MSNYRAPQGRESCYSVVEATLAHAAELAPRMRAADIAEVAAFGYSPYAALEFSLRGSRSSYAGLVDGRVVCMFGVYARTFCADEGNPWLLTATDLPRYAKAFLRLNRVYVSQLRAEFKFLSGWVHASNLVSMNWLRWLGFAVTNQGALVGESKEMFYRFTMDCRE